jgi:hypothetical protein
MFIGCSYHVVFDLDLCGINSVRLFCKGLCLPENFKNHTFACILYALILSGKLNMRVLTSMYLGGGRRVGYSAVFNNLIL